MALLRIRKPDGEIVEIASLPGAKGEDGKTPEKGVDYFTPEEQEAFLASAKTYADEQDDLLEEKLNSAYAAANAYTDEKAALAEDNAKAYMDEQLGDIETALDGILAMQEALIGGDTE